MQPVKIYGIYDDGTTEGSTVPLKIGSDGSLDIGSLKASVDALKTSTDAQKTSTDALKTSVDLLTTAVNALAAKM
jgi:hypothetical protein